MTETTSPCGLELKSGMRELMPIWVGKRPFAYLPSHEPGSVFVEVDGKEPTVSQQHAFHSFLDDEQTICESVLEVTLRSCHSEFHNRVLFRRAGIEPLANIAELRTHLEYEPVYESANP